jgi:two-component system, sporulation sensor kinase B
LFKDLLFQVVVILFPVLLYYSFFTPNGYQLKKKEKKIMIASLTSISVMLCMSFPVAFGDETILDLRSVPWLIAFFYGGNVVGVIVTLVLFTFRFSISMNTGAYITLFTYTFSALFIIFLYKNYMKQVIKKKVVQILTMGFITTMILVIKIYIFVFNFSLNNETVVFLVFFILINLVTLLVVTSLIEAFEDRNLLHQQMQLKEKQYIVGQLAASVAHEIRNPMTVVSGFIQLINQDKATPPSHTKYTKLMMQELDRAEAIIKDYLSLAKNEAGKLEKLNVNKKLMLVNDTLQGYALLNGVNLTVKYPDENLHIYGDKNKFTQVLVNIIKNAIEASEGRGEVLVSALKESDSLIIEIKDEGKGMTEAQLKNLGVPFYSMKDKGTGLGLMVCYNIIGAMKGKIKVESELGVGTTFKIILPTLAD